MQAMQQHRALPRARATTVVVPRRTVPAARAVHTAAVKGPSYAAALIFDCDGVIVETEELHRQAYNGSFKEFGLTINGTPLDWSVEYYDVLQNTVGGGKPKMRYHFTNNGWPAVRGTRVPETEEERTALIDELQDKKTDIYKRIVEEVAAARPGVVELMDEALSRPDLAVCICSAATKGGFEKLVSAVLGKERLARFDIVLAGDDVERKKPDPQIYNIARERLGLPASRCIVIEDSMVGLRAATAAGMQCIITPTSSTAGAAFTAEGALAVVPALAGPGYALGVDDLFNKDAAGDLTPNANIQALVNGKQAVPA